jgi:hypothetical protein
MLRILDNQVFLLGLGIRTVPRSIWEKRQIPSFLRMCEGMCRTWTQYVVK